MEKPKILFQILPLFRKDLKIYPGPDEADGSPTFNLHDPVRGQYFKLGWKESLIIKCLKPNMSPQALAEEINRVSTLQVDAEDIDRIFFQCASMDLLRVSKGSDYYQRKEAAKKVNFWNWIIQHYLYIRIPLLNPDRFLKNTLSSVQFLGSKKMFAVYIFGTLLGLYLMMGRFDEFLHTFTYFFNMQGFIIYAFAISGVKLIHEFSHAYVGKRFGLHIPTMGIALLVLWPVLYTDVTDGWKLSKRSRRIAISFAGIAAELVVAGLSTLGWVLSNPGMLQSVFFVLATTGWFSTIAINMNPAVRFDGYYILCDLIGIDNLQTRAFNVLRWRSYAWLFGITTPSPEETLSPALINTMTLYALYTYIYRIILYTAIAVFVYFEFTKALGIVLFLAEIVIFMIYPFIYEFKELYMVRHLWKWNTRSIVTFTLLGLAAAWFILPLPHEETFPAVIAPSKVQVLYVPYDSTVKTIYAKLDEHIAEGQSVLELSSKPLMKELGEALLQKEDIELQIRSLSTEKTDINHLAEKQAELERANEYYSELSGKQKNLNMKADLTGTLFSWNNDLKAGQTVPEGAIIGKLADPNDKYAIAFIPETRLEDLKVGQKAIVMISNPSKYFTGVIERINPTRSTNLDYLSLASTNKGPLPVSPDAASRSLLIVESYYAVYVKMDQNEASSLGYGQTAEVRFKGVWYSKLLRLLTYVKSIVIKESSL